MLQESYDQSPHVCAAHDDQRRLGGMRRDHAPDSVRDQSVTLGQDRQQGLDRRGPRVLTKNVGNGQGVEMHAEKLDGHAQRSEGGDRPPPGQEEQRRENQAHVRRQVGYAHVETERNSPSSLELHRDALRSLERDLDGAPGQAAATEELERLACRSEERSQQPTCEDLISLEPLHSPEREVLDCLAADPGRPSGLHVGLAEEEQLSAVGRPQLDDCVKREP